jgi:hypothetical protein
MMRTIKENDVFFEDLMKLNTTFYWKGHELQLNGNHIQVFIQDAFNELKTQTSKEFHTNIRLFNRPIST